MAKAGRRSRVKDHQDANVRRGQLLDAAFEALRAEGFAQASARSIAARAGVNPALIFYYFDSVNDLLVEALGRSSRTQLASYEQALANVMTWPEMVAAVQDQLRADMGPGSGHVRVLAELIAAGVSDPAMGDAVMGHVRPWLEFSRSTLERVGVNSALASVVPPDQAAFALVALFLGMELLAGTSGDEMVLNGLFETAGRLVQVVSGVVESPASPLEASVVAPWAAGS